MAKRRRRAKVQKMNNFVWTSVLGVFFCALSVLLLASFLRQGFLLIWIYNFMTSNFGAGALALPFVCLHLGLVLFQTRWIWSRPQLLAGSILFFLGLTFISSGGSVGSGAMTGLSRLITHPGAIICFLCLIIGGQLILWQISVKDITDWWHAWSTERELRKQMAPVLAEQEDVAFVGQNNGQAELPLSDEDEFVPIKAATEDTNRQLLEPEDEEASSYVKSIDEKHEVINSYDKIDLLGEIKKPVVEEPVTNENGEVVHQPWVYPSIDLLEAVDGGEADRGDINANAQIIENTLDSFGVRARVVEINRGPSVTQYALEIAMGTKLSKITTLATDLALALAAPTGQIRIEAPIAGKSLVGIEVPNRKAAFVTLRKMLSQNVLKENPSKLAVAMGIDVNGKEIVGDIAKMPHVLIAGATGSGKSVGINSFLCSLLFRCSPEELRLILVDPKRVELTMYQDIPHLLTPVIVEAQKVVSALRSEERRVGKECRSRWSPYH